MPNMWVQIKSLVGFMLKAV